MMMTDWKGLESRLREILRDAEADTREDAESLREVITRVDECLAAFTGRGNELSSNAFVSAQDERAISAEEWRHASRRARYRRQSV